MKKVGRFHYKMDLKLLPMLSNKDRNIPGTLEVWPSPAALKEFDLEKVDIGERC